MAGNIRDRARQYLMQVPPIPMQVTSNGPLAALYTKLTGITQEQLDLNWAAGGIRTGCNEFVGYYGVFLGSKQYLGCFNLDQVCAQRKKAYAWIPATSGALPQFGDIFEIKTKLHMGISLDFEGSFWNSAEAGQGGKSTGYDIIMRKKAAQGGSNLVNLKGELVKGWVDIDLYINGQPVNLPVPMWLLGWWSVPWRGQVFYYYFMENNQVVWTFAKPVSDYMAPYKYDDTGKVTINGPNSLTIVWGATGSIEKFKSSSADNQVMTGDWDSAEPLTATRCFYNPSSI